MILTQLKDHLVVNGRTSRSALAKQFGLSADGVDAMLAIWIKKGKVSKALAGNTSDPRGQDASEVWYRWNDESELAITTMS
jgi:putative ferrous iron transport protein C